MTPFSSCFHRNASVITTEKGQKDMDKILSTTLDDESCRGGNVCQNLSNRMTPGHLSDHLAEVLHKDGIVDGSNTVSMHKKTQTKPTKKAVDLQFGSQRTRARKAQRGKKWYDDSDEEDKDEMMLEQMSVKNKVTSNQDEEKISEVDLWIEGSMVELPERNCNEPELMPVTQSRFESNRLIPERKNRVRTRNSESDENGEVALSFNPRSAHDTTKTKPNALGLLTKTRTVSSLGTNGNESGYEAPDAPAISVLAAAESKCGTVSVSKHLVVETVPPSSAGIGRPTAVQTGGNEVASTVLVNRRTNQLKHSASGCEYSELPRLAIGSNDEVFSPGLRKLPGALPGTPGSGVLLEGWLRQKQRRGMKGLKRWNLRYFVLYARSNEVRYYADVVQSAWGPIPLGEIGSISLRLIQRIGKLSHPKYKGCRFDITCRNSWGTHSIDDYVSSDEENASSNNNVNSTNSNNEKTGATVSKQDKGGTPRSSRVYSLVADSPQVTVAWVNMLDSLLTRSANSPRPDLGSPAKTTNETPTVNVSQAGARQPLSALDTESFVILGPGECVPKATIYAINFIFDSTPGIETEMFHEVEPDAMKLKAALKFLNAFAGEAVTCKPTKEELEKVLDAITASGVVRLWLQQLDHPLIPSTMYNDFETLAREAKQTARTDFHRKLCALLKSLPKRNITMLACLLFHLNDVNVYSSKNGMNAARLASYFGQFVLYPPQKKSSKSTNSTGDVNFAVNYLIEEMITNVDTFIDEKEAQLLEDNRL